MAQTNNAMMMMGVSSGSGIGGEHVRAGSYGGGGSTTAGEWEGINHGDDYNDDEY